MLDHKVRDGVLIVYLKGRLDVSIANEVEENLNDLIDNQGHKK
ncbi:hypothetical protein LEP1GSC037_5814 [Leptospira interrogans str. 2006001854]|nr:hypothetical protein LEP1GSC037_5814 [Leptospira interrogans str. 2006001854]